MKWLLTVVLVLAGCHKQTTRIVHGPALPFPDIGECRYDKAFPCDPNDPDDMHNCHLVCTDAEGHELHIALNE